MKFTDIPKFTSEGHYKVNQSWRSIENWIERHADMNLNLDPDFQRPHVWSEAQQTAFVEFALKGGRGSSLELRFNCVGWMRDFRGPFVIVDGKQCLEAARKFMRNELKAFGHYFEDFEDKMPYDVDFILMVNDLKTRKEVLQWYLDINAGGVVHTNEELDRVRDLLIKEG